MVMLDKKIDLLEQKHQFYQDFKKYLMQQIFAQKLRFANFTDDCLYCKYCISHSYKMGFLCSGRRRVATVKDLKTPEEQRIRDSNNELAAEREAAFAAGRCPYCGAKLVERNGNYGKFWGCWAFPHCRFTASVDPNTGEIKMKG